MKINHTIILIVIMSIFGACTMPSSGSSTPNPFFSESSLYLKYPPFDKIKNEHYAPAFKLGMKQHMQEIDSIALDQDLASSTSCYQESMLLPISQRTLLK